MSKETFYLKDSLPSLPCIHDGVIKEIKFDNQYLTFVFDDDISGNDSLKYYNPNAKSLIIRYHLICENDSVYAYELKKASKLSGGKIRYEEIEFSKLLKKSKTAFVEYLSHFIDFGTIIIRLQFDTETIMHADVDFVEYEWIE